MPKKRKVSQEALNKARDALIAALDGDENDVKFATDLAVEIISRDYMSDVRSIGDELIRQMKAGEFKDTEAFEEALNQDVDSQGRIIYTFQAKLGLIATENEDAYEEEMGQKPESPEAQLHFAMMLDVRSYVEREVGDIEEFIEEHQR